MSLPIGTLVMVVQNAEHPELIGATGEIVCPLTFGVTYRYPSGEPYVCWHYDVDLPRHRDTCSGEWSTDWSMEPHEIIPITPPGNADDVTTDEPIKDEVTA